MQKSKDDRLRELRKLICAHDEKYYRDTNPSISDQEYDRLKKELDHLEVELDPLGLFKSEPVSPGKEKENLPEVGDDRLDSFVSHKHLLPMLSLDNTYDDAVFFFNDTATTEIYTLSLHDALPI